MTNDHDDEYARLLNLVIKKGRIKKNRTGVDTKSIFGAQAMFDLSKGFPLLTTKKVFFKGIIHELLWFLKGDTNIKYLVDNDVHIWDVNCYDRYLKLCKNSELDLEFMHVNSINDKQQFIAWIKNDPEFANKWGELGEGTYGGMWRAFPYHVDKCDSQSGNHAPELGYVDQIARIIDKLKNNPDDRRIIVSAWHPYWVDHCCLPPCHVLMHFNTEELTVEERWAVNTKIIACYTDEAKEKFCDSENIPKRRLNCMLYQRSCDMGLGFCFNLASYSLLTHMIAQVTNMVPGTFVWTGGDTHIYANHIEPLKEQLSRSSFQAPSLWLNPEIKNIDNFKCEDIKVVDYKSHPIIKMDMAA